MSPEGRNRDIPGLRINFKPLNLNIMNSNEKSRELHNEVDNWVKRSFNFIQLEVFEKIAEDFLHEYIEDVKPDHKEFLRSYQLEKDLLNEHNENNEEKIKDIDDLSESDIIEFCENHEQFDRYLYDLRSENYPMWNTLFEYDSNFSESEKEKIKSLGMGIVSGLEPFNDTIFMRSCGHSFYGSYWIPLYLALFPSKMNKYKDVKYNHL